jgi:hypothetical protein
MFKIKAMTGLLIVVLIGQPFNAAAQTQTSIKEQLDKIPIGKTIEVRLLREDNYKIKGKLISISSESFEVQTKQPTKESTEKIAFTDVKSVKASGMSTGKKIAIGVGIGLAAVGVFTLIAIARWASNEGW